MEIMAHGLLGDGGGHHREEIDQHGCVAIAVAYFPMAQCTA